MNIDLFSSDFKYQSPGKCPTPTTAAPAGASTAKAALPTTKKPSALAQAVLPSSTKKPAVAAQAPLPSSTRRPAPAIPAGSSTTTKPKTQ